MERLQELDTAIFRFVNQTISNPFFDWLMPVLSGNVLFFPCVVLIAAWLVWKFRARGACCLLMLALIVGPGDGFISDTIRDIIGRPRPFVTMPETTRLPAGRGGKVGMPSSHAANWGSATMILFIYFRRSLWITAPLGTAVCFSRVYNGVHYPSDVLVGAMLGATYGAILVFTFDAIWRRIGPRFFPNAAKRLPTLIPPPPNIDADPPGTKRQFA